MLRAGDHVRVLSLKTIVGTIEGSKHEDGCVKYLFRCDPRGAEQVGEFYVMDGDVELLPPRP